MVAFRHGRDRIMSRQAEEMMGRNMIPLGFILACYALLPDELEKCKNLEFNPLPFSLDTLEECRESHILVADSGDSIHEISSIQTQTSGIDPDSLTNRFQHEKAAPTWRLVRIAPLAKTFGERFRRQESLIGLRDSIPSARTLVYTMLAWLMKSRERLFEDALVRTSSRFDEGALDYKACVGEFDESGVRMEAFWDEQRISSLGLATERKPDFQNA
jgi:hypothetical protein